MPQKKEPPTRHPGLILQELLGELNISQYKISKDICVPPRRINEIVLGKRSITADTSLRLARYFDLSDDYWINLQRQFDLYQTKQNIGEEIKRNISPYE